MRWIGDSCELANAFPMARRGASDPSGAFESYGLTVAGGNSSLEVYSRLASMYPPPSNAFGVTEVGCR
eukprot:1177944-Amorphochlora_amoeboformis.AAC.1